jgi:hypothetical protein
MLVFSRFSPKKVPFEDTTDAVVVLAVKDDNELVVGKSEVQHRVSESVSLCAHTRQRMLCQIVVIFVEEREWCEEDNSNDNGDDDATTAIVGLYIIATV